MQIRQFIQGFLRQRIVFPERQLYVLGHGQGADQSAILEGHAITLNQTAAVHGRQALHVPAIQIHAAAVRVLQPKYRAQQHRLAGPGTAHHAEYFVLSHFHVESVVHHLRAEAIVEAAHPDHRIEIRVEHQKLICTNNTANSASARITIKIDCTTATVVSRPSSRAESRTCMPRYVPTMAMRMANTGALTKPAQKVVGESASCMRAVNCGNGMCRLMSDSRPPPARPMASAITVSSGRTMTSANTLGTTSNSTGFIPIARSASVSSFSCMTPISAAKALPERPATMMAVNSTPISRNTAMVTRSTTKISAPKRDSCCAPR